ncbi:ankyrin repeat domain-containing protein [Flavobacterium sp. MFBS3-15]|uniref:ankyrin repeat domain-containing protein n=1 Tax=Flavobacterium sp. MFBS3-15 TaxID=2989816 RepID=UPI002236B30B|nr:ankyrin repeat domain-containing protein [Flavobacterium sp. MFBS3-15]MCW4467605.1 ankyrin repeat domain-containing protein [Flavobacterium sp. MFBS3-15]
MDEITQALFLAARQGNVPVLEEIFPLIDNVDRRDDRGFTPLIIAAYNNQPEAVAALLKAGAHPDLADKGANTALMGASFKGHADVARILIGHGASLDAQHGNGGTALMFASMFGRNELVELLLAHGAATDIKDARGFTALDLALQQNNMPAAEYIQNYQSKRPIATLPNFSKSNLQ